METAGTNHVGLDRRAVLESLCSVKYMLLYTGHDYLAPYGFKQIQTSADEVWSLYENQYALPIGYTYSEAIDYDTYLDMDGIEKQNAMLKTVALQGYDGNLLSNNSELTAYTYKTADYEIIDSQNVEMDDTYIHTAQDASLTIAVTLKEDCENYLFINTQTTNTYVTLEDTELYLRGNQLANLGYSEQNREIEVTIYFGAELELTLNQIYMGYYNLGQYAADIAQRSEDCMENVEMSANTITGNLSLSEDRILCMSVPYLKGWRAWIDGGETTVYLANSMLMAIEVPAGEHEITFTYCTPGIRLGCAVTGIAAVLCVIILIRKRKAVRNG